ncbi:MAG: di-heme oxidoredictase family protein [bacterium]
MKNKETAFVTMKDHGDQRRSKIRKSIRKHMVLVMFLLFLSLNFIASVSAGITTGEGPNLGEDRITMEDICMLPLKAIQDAGLRIFSTPFNKLDGYGDGPLDPNEGDPILLGNRPTLQHNGTFLRVNGLDGQSCLECHFIGRNSTIPATFGIGGTSGPVANAIQMPSFIDVAEMNPGDFNGRFINPPQLFGIGGIELVAREMTAELQKLKAEAISNPDTPVSLNVKGVCFGTITADGDGNIDPNGIIGIDDDLVVRPFGRKGEFFRVRDFDLTALQFHFGMQPVEVVGAGVDADNDCVPDEILIGEVSAIHIFVTTLPKTLIEKPTPKILEGYKLFRQIGCTYCHTPFFVTESRILTYSYPEDATDPTADIYDQANLTAAAGFRPAPSGGLIVQAFSDFKRHDMGPGLAESFDLADEQMNREFISASLRGVRDTAPYLHDGRATTITEAILMLGGEAQTARDTFADLNQADKDKLIAFLYSLRTPLTNSSLGSRQSGNDPGGEDILFSLGK